MIRAVIFDMDGLLIDSEPLWQQAEIEVFGTVGVALDERDCLETMGLRADEVVAYRFARNPWNGPSRTDIEHAIVARVRELIAERGERQPGVDAVLRLVRDRSVPVALASSSSYAIIRTVLERLGLREVFTTVYSAEEEPYGKPHPGVYLTTAARLGVAPATCLAFEDSPNGIRAAKAAGMKCVAVPNRFEGPPSTSLLAVNVPATGDRADAAGGRTLPPPSTLDSVRPDLVLASLGDFDAGAWEALDRT